MYDDENNDYQQHKKKLSNYYFLNLFPIMLGGVVYVNKLKFGWVYLRYFSNNTLKYCFVFVFQCHAAAVKRKSFRLFRDLRKFQKQESD